MRTFAFTVCLCLTTASVQAQSTPEEAATAVAAANRAMDWGASVRLMHPSALRELRELFRPIVASHMGGAMATQLFGIPDLAAFDAMPDSALLSSMSTRMLASVPEAAEAARTAVTRVMGHVMAGPDTALVVMHQSVTMSGMQLSAHEVWPFLREDGRWWALLKGDTRGMAAGLRQMAGIRD